MKIFSINFIILLAIIGSTFQSSGQNSKIDLNKNKYNSKIEEFEKNVKTLMEIDKSPGIVVAFVKGDFIWSKGFGTIDLENESEISSESLFKNKTLLRFMIVSGILKLYEEGGINIDNKVQTYLPEFPIQQEQQSIREILNIINPILFISFNKDNSFWQSENANSTDEETENCFKILISIIEKTSGKKIELYLKEQIWNPLLMFNTRLENKNEIIKNRVKAYTLNKGQLNNIINNNNLETDELLQIRTTVNDMIKLAYGFYSNKSLPKYNYTSLFSINNNEQKLIQSVTNWKYQPINGRFGFGFLNDYHDDNTILACFPQDTFIIAIASNLKDADLFPYMKRLYHLIMDEPYSLIPYSANSKVEKIFKLMNVVFSKGLASYSIIGNETKVQEAEYRIF